GFHEMLAGAVLDDLPRGSAPRRFAVAERAATELYRSLWPLFHQLASIAVAATALVLLTAIAACVLNNRRLPIEIVRNDTPFRRLRNALVRTTTAVAVRAPLAQAGFFFSLQSLARSAPHRMTMAAATAVAVSVVVMTVSGIDTHRAGAVAEMPVSALA